MPDDCRISRVTLDEGTIVRWNADIDHERKVAIFDLVDGNYFAPRGGNKGPFHLLLSIEERRLVLDIRSEKGDGIDRISLPLGAFRRIMRDYFAVCDSYFQAIRTAPPSRIEAIDMGRKSLHDDGSKLLQERLADKIEVDFPTARRLFTLLCVITLRG